jgi:hypothetical protein
MGFAEKLAGGLVAVALVTTLVLPDRITVQALRAAGDLLTGVFRAAMGR